MKNQLKIKGGNMKIGFIGDAHENKFWGDAFKNLIYSDCDKMILLGDIMDRGNINININNLKLILDHLNEKIIFLVGNHDIVYLNENRLRISPTHYDYLENYAPEVIEEVKDLFRGIYDKSDMKGFVIFGKYIFSHAGIIKDISDAVNHTTSFEQFIEELNKLENDETGILWNRTIKLYKDYWNIKGHDSAFKFYLEKRTIVVDDHYNTQTCRYCILDTDKDFIEVFDHQNNLTQTQNL
jgi:predicted MPP superfamily phosphohydrolase